MRPSKKLIATFALSLMLLSSCSASADLSSHKDSPAQEAPNQGQSMDGAASFDLSFSDRLRLEEKAKNGDGVSAFKLFQFWAIAGGIPASNKQQRDKEAMHWLQLAANNGYEDARHNLAVESASVDCAEARKTLGQLAKSANDPKIRTSAEFWLRDGSLCAARRAAP